MSNIRVFSPNDTVFTTNGNKVLQPIKCEETKVLGESWTIKVRLGIEYIDYVAQDYIVVVPTKYGDQPFRINNITVDNNRIDFTAWHIGYDSKNYLIKSVTATGKTASECLTLLDAGTIDTNNFTVYSDIAGTKTSTYAKVSLYEALLTAQTTYGGYLDFDKWQIRLTTALGADRGVTIEYGKNLEDAKVVEDWSEVCTKIFPVGRDGLTIVGDTLTSATTYSIPYTRTVNFDTANVTELGTLAQAYLDIHDKPKVNYVVESTLQNVYLNDTIVVKSDQFTLTATVLSYTYDTLSGLNTKVEFGNYRADLKTYFSAITDRMDAIGKQVVAVGDITQQQTELINAVGDYGYCIKTKNELYFVDTLPKESATNVLRLNVAGIGFSTTGYAGPFTTAWTIDGKFSADFIQAGTLTGREINNGSGTFNVLADGTLTASSGKIASWSITDGKIYGGDGSTNKVAVMQLPSSTSTYVFAAGGTSHTSYADCPFRVDKTGKLYSTSAVIAGWTVSSSAIYKGAIKLDSTNERVYFNTGAYFGAGVGTTDVYMTGTILAPATGGGVSLGTSTNYWSSSYFSNIYPYSNGAGNLGSSTIRWGNAYIDSLSLRFSSTNYTITRDTNGFLKAV